MKGSGGEWGEWREVGECGELGVIFKGGLPLLRGEEEEEMGDQYDRLLGRGAADSGKLRENNKLIKKQNNCMKFKGMVS